MGKEQLDLGSLVLREGIPPGGKMENEWVLVKVSFSRSMFDQVSYPPILLANLSVAGVFRLPYAQRGHDEQGEHA